MMSEASLTVGDLTAFLLYAAYTGMSMGGETDQLAGTESIVESIESTVGNTIVDHSDVVGASPVGAAPTTSSFPT